MDIIQVKKPSLVNYSEALSRYFSKWWIRFLLVAFLFGLLLFLNDYETVLYGDAEAYWLLSVSFFKPFSKDGFALLNYDNPIRGYLFPATLLPAYAFCYFTHVPAAWVIKLMGAAWAGLLFGVLLPAFWQKLTGRTPRWSVISLALLLGFGYWSWGDYFSFSLTDFPAFALLLMALLALQRDRFWWWLAAGLALAAALNFRPIYLAAVPGVALLAFYRLYGLRAGRLRCAGSLVVGVALVLLPQFLINARNFNVNSPLVTGQLNKKTAIFKWHLAWGLRVSKLEACLMKPFGKSQLVVVADPAGERLLQELTGGAAFATEQQYATAVVRRPAAFAALFGRHLFQGLNIELPSPYLVRSNRKGILFSLVNYSVLFWGVVMLGRIRFRPPVLFQLLALVLVVVATLPLVMEPRFAMPLHLLLATAATLGASPPVWWRLLKKSRPIRLRLLVGYGIWMLGCLTLMTSLKATTHLQPVDYFTQSH